MPPDWCNTTTAVLVLDRAVLADRPDRVSLLGAPGVASLAGHEGLAFDGVDDGLVASCNPLTGVQAFAIEMLIAPASGGPEEQRFLHIQDDAGRRLLLELRMVGPDAWTLDTFLREDDANRRTLIDRTKTHPTDRWHWVALRYDGRMMQHYVDGVLESEGPVALQPFTTGRISLGARLNQVSWYKGLIREVRIHRTLLPAEALQRP
ncbi:MAG: LamG domain-containing protein [Opitutaceae bacterium]|nr:LamG domain-containing protein [Opitutaceae bacterium]